METAVRQDLPTTPLTTISARRINSTSTASSVSENQNQENQTAQKRAEQQIRQQEQQFIQQLSARDREVRAHEAAHVAAAGQYVVSGPSYSYQRGPDGRLYAIGGEVQLDTSPIPGDPEATLRKAEVVRRAALAPAQPSSQDISVAASATQAAARARVEIAVQRREEAIKENEEKLEAQREQSSDNTKLTPATENEEVSTSAVEPEQGVPSVDLNAAPAVSVVQTSNSTVLQAFNIQEPQSSTISQFA